MSDETVEGYTDFEEENNDKTINPNIDEENTIKEDKKSDIDPVENQILEPKSEPSKISNSDISSEKKETLKEVLEDKKNLNSLFKKDESIKENKEERDTYKVDRVYRVKEFFDLFTRYQKENKNLLHDVEIKTSEGDIIKLGSVKKEKSDYEKFMSKLNLNNNIKIPLYNSGIVIDIKECVINDLLLSINNIQEEIDNTFYRSIFIYYFFVDYLFLKEIKNFLSACITGSSFEKEPRDIFDFISLHDIDVIVIYVIKLMFKDGYDGFELLCEHDDCKHKEVITVKPENFIYTNFDKINYEMRQYFSMLLRGSEKLELETFDEAKKVLYKDFKYTYEFEDQDFPIKSFTIEMQDVSVNKFLNLASEYMDELNDQIEDVNITREMEMMRYNVIRHILPHIKTLIIKNRKFKTGEKENIEIEGDELIIENDVEKIDFINSATNSTKDGQKVLDFLNDKIYGNKFTHILLENTNCTMCKRPMYKDKEYVPIVPFLFFFMTLIEYVDMKQSKT